MRDERPLALVLHCPNCGLQHIDAPDPAVNWTNPPHRSHLCQNPECGTVWRPCDIATTGVAALATRGKSDTWPPAVGEAAQAAAIAAGHAETIAGERS